MDDAIAGDKLRGNPSCTCAGFREELAGFLRACRQLWDSIPDQNCRDETVAPHVLKHAIDTCDEFIAHFSQFIQLLHDYRVQGSGSSGSSGVLLPHQPIHPPPAHLLVSSTRRPPQPSNPPPAEFLSADARLKECMTLMDGVASKVIVDEQYHTEEGKVSRFAMLCMIDKAKASLKELLHKPLGTAPPRPIEKQLDSVDTDPRPIVKQLSSVETAPPSPIVNQIGSVETAPPQRHRLPYSTTPQPGKKRKIVV